MSEVETKTPDKWVGQLIDGRYEIKRLLGKGATGAVYEAHDLTIDRRVALKRLRSKFTTNKGVWERFRREAATAGNIGNKHIIEVHDIIFRTDLPPFLVLEYLDGTSLDEDIEDNRQSLDRVARIVIQICDALIALHEQDIVHRDLKPENIFLIRKDGVSDFVKVLDFGIAMMRHPVSPQADKLTVPGEPIGTPGYMSPEQCEGSTEIDKRSDIYSLGAVLYFALTSKAPIVADSFAKLLVKVCNEEPTPITEWRRDVPPEIVAIIGKALAKNPKDRFSTALEFKRALWWAVWPDSDQEPGNFSIPPKPTTRIEPFLKQWVVPAAVGCTFFLLGTLAYNWHLNRPSVRETEPDTNPAVAHESESKTTEVTRLKKESNPRFDKSESLVQIRIRTEPENARIYLDGKKIINPYDEQLPREKRDRVIRAVKRGYETWEQRFVPDRDQSLFLKLKPLPAAKRKTAGVRRAASIPTKRVGIDRGIGRDDVSSTSRLPESGQMTAPPTSHVSKVSSTTTPSASQQPTAQAADAATGKKKSPEPHEANRIKYKTRPKRMPKYDPLIIE